MSLHRLSQVIRCRISYDIANNEECHAHAASTDKALHPERPELGAAANTGMLDEVYRYGGSGSRQVIQES